MKFLSDRIINDKITENECYLLGQIPLNNEEYESILEYTKYIIDVGEKNLSDSYDLPLSLGLVLIAITDYSDGNYWFNVACKLDTEEIPATMQRLLGTKFINTLKHYNLFRLKQEPGESNKYVENIKAHAFVTNNYMSGYYDFLFDYYENNLFNNINDDVEETLQDLSDYIKFQKNDTVYSDTAQGKASKSYKLLKATREVIAQCDGDILYKLFYPSLKIIDDYFYDGKLPDNLDNRFSKVFIEWNNKKENKQERNNNKFDRRNNSRKPYLMLNTSKYVNTPFILYIPARRFRQNECDGYATSTVSINGIPRKPKNLEIRKKWGAYISEQIIEPIGYPFDEIKISIDSLESKEIIIPSKDYAIFNSNYIKKDRFEKGTNYLLVKKGTNIKFSNNSILIDSDYTNDEWDRFDLNISEESIVYINNKPLTIIGEYSKEPTFEYQLDYFTTFNEEGKKVITTRMHPLISMEILKNKRKGATIQINNKNISLDNENVLEFESPDNNNKLIVSLDLNDYIELQNDYYKVGLNIVGEKVTPITEYILLDGVRFIFDRTRYINETNAKLTLKNNGLDITIDDNNCELIYSNEYRNNDYYQFDLTSDYQNINIKLLLNNSIYSIKLPIPMMLYGFSKEFMTYNEISEIWYSNLKELFYIKLPGAKELSLYSNNFKRNEPIANTDIVKGVLTDENIYCVNISKIIDMIKNNKYNQNYYELKIQYIDNKVRKLPLFKVIRNLRINPYFNLYLDNNNIICFDANFKEIENVNIYYDVKDCFKQKLIIEKRKLINGVNLLPECEKERKYLFIPYIEEVDEFGLNSNISTLPVRKDGLITIEDYSNCTLYLTQLLINKDNAIINQFHKYKIRIYEKENFNYYNASFIEQIGTTPAKVIAQVSAKFLYKTDSGQLAFRLIFNYSDMYYNIMTRRLLKVPSGITISTNLFKLEANETIFMLSPIE